jgi:histidine triad (HIT) family protein
MSDCIFCRIISGEIPSNKVLEEDDFIAMKDVNPQAPTHILIVPKTHIPNVTASDNTQLLGKLLQQAKVLSEKLGITNGFRLVINTGNWGGQTVDHLHIHFLAGRALGWPPG